MNAPQRPSIVLLIGSRALFGAERANIDLVHRLHEDGARVTCIVRDEEWPENLALRRVLEDHGLSWRTCPTASYPSRHAWRYAAAIVRENLRAFTLGNRRFLRICEEVEATHVLSFNPFLTFAFWPALSWTPLPLIYHGGDYPTVHNVFWRLVWRWIARRVAHVGVKSPLLVPPLRQLGVPADHLSVLPSPPPHRPEGEVFDPRRVEGSRPVFCFVGQLIPQKGVAELLAAFAEVVRAVPTARLLVAGAGADAWAERVRSHGQALEDAVHFLGFVEDVAGLLRRVDVHVAPSIEPEGYGLVAVEAKQAGLPSIVFDGGGLSELVEDGVDGIVVRERTAAALAAAMLRYCDDPERARADGERALASLTERLGLPHYAARWRAIFDATMPAA